MNLAQWIIALSMSAMLVWLIYEVGRYDARQKMRKRMVEWLEENPETTVRARADQFLRFLDTR